MEAEVATKEDLQGQIEQEWQALASLLETLDEAQLGEPVLENGWSAKDVLAHIMSWEQYMIEWVGALVAGGEPERPFSGDDWIDRVNERVFNEHRSVPLAEVREAFARSHQEALAMVAELEPEVLFEPERFHWLQGAPLWRMVAANTFWHYREHREQIAAHYQSR